MSALDAGQVFGRFTIINAVSATELIETYRAYDSAVGRDVTLKVFTRTAGANRELNERFHRGVVALLDLAHPNILDIHDAGEIDGLLYLAMPLVEGETLAQRVALGNLSADDVDRIVRQISEALEYAHAHGIAHGELGLDDVLLDARGNVQLGDFGVGTALSTESPGAARQRDIAGLGALALALLAGKKMLERDAPVADAVRPWLERLPPAVRVAAAERVERFIAKAVSPKAAERFETVAEFLTAWARVRGDAPRSQPPAAEVDSASRQGSAGQIVANRKADAASLVHARTEEYERERRERIAAAERGAADARARVEHETRERASALRRAQSQRDEVFGGTHTPAASRADRATRETLSRLLRVINAVAAQRANMVGLPSRPLGRTLDAGDLAQARSLALAGNASAAMRSAPAAQTVGNLPLPRVDLNLESERLRRLAQKGAALSAEAQHLRQQAQQAGAAVPRPAVNVRNMVIGVSIALFVLVCVLPPVCFSLLLAIPDVQATPAATARRQAGIPSPTPAPVVTEIAPAISAPTSTPRPTITPFVRPSNTPAAPPISSVLAFTDTFTAGACRLPQRDTAAGSQLCADGEYRILTRGGAPFVQTYEDLRGDVIIEADVRAVARTSSLAYGIVWRADPDRYYGFTIDPDGDLAALESVRGDTTYWIKGLNFSAVQKGGATNRLRVSSIGQRLTFAVNSQDVPFSFSKVQPAAGRVGFIVMSEESGAQVAFSRLSVWDVHLLTPGAGSPVPLPTR